MEDKQPKSHWYTMNKETQENIKVYGTIALVILAILTLHKEISEFFSSIFSLTGNQALVLLLIVLLLGVIFTIGRLILLLRKYKRLSYQDVGKINVHVDPSASQASQPEKYKWPLKLYFEFRNNSKFPVVLDNLLFKFGTGIAEHPAPDRKISPGTYKPVFLLRTVGQEEVWVKGIVLSPDQITKTFITIKNDFGKDAVETAIKNKTIGDLSFRAILLDEPTVTHQILEHF